MTRKKSTKRTLLMSALSLVMCVTMLIGSTFAWFTDSVTSGNNKIESGNLDIELWHCPNNKAQWGYGFDEANGTEIEGDTALFLNVDGNPILWEPGAGAGETFRVKNAGNLALKFKLNLKTVNATKTPEGKDLTDVLQLQIIELQTLENGAPAFADNGVWYEGLFGDGYVIEGELLPNETADFNVAIDWFPGANDNDYNVAGGLEIDFAIELLATQLTNEKDSWDDQYDKDADYDGEISTADALTAALANGGTYKLLNNIDVKGNAIEIADGVEVVLDMGDKVITGKVAKSDGAALIKNNGTLTIKNGSVKNETVNGSAVIANNGTMVLDGVAITGAPIDTTGYPEYAVTTSGKLTIEEGTTVTSDRGAVRTSAGAELIINGGTFVVSDAADGRNMTLHTIYAYGEGTTVTINGGTFEQNHSSTGGASVICPAGASINIYDGNFSDPMDDSNWQNTGNFQNYMGYSAPVKVYGGTYSDKTVNKHLAEGYVAVKAGNDTYTVLDFSDKTLLAEGLYTDAAGNYYVVSADGLMSMREQVGTWGSDTLAGKSINIMTDIDATEKTWTTAVIASGSASRNGFTFNGNGHTISNLTIVSDTTNATPGTGLFAMNSGNNTPTVFKDITFDNVTVNGGIHTGVLWGQVYGKIVADNVHVINSNVTGTSNVGALIGRNGDDGASEITFKNCSVKNTNVTSTGGGDNAGASAFLGMALKVAVNGVSVDLKFEGTNVSEGNTLTTVADQQGGGIYTTSAWGESSWDAPVVVADFTNHNNN